MHDKSLAVAGVATKGGMSKTSLSRLLVVVVAEEEACLLLLDCCCCCCDKDEPARLEGEDEKARTKPRTLVAVGLARPEGREGEGCVGVWLGAYARS